MNLINKFDLKSIFSKNLYLGENFSNWSFSYLRLPIGYFFNIPIFIAFRKIKI